MRIGGMTKSRAEQRKLEEKLRLEVEEHKQAEQRRLEDEGKIGREEVNGCWRRTKGGGRMQRGRLTRDSDVKRKSIDGAEQQRLEEEEKVLEEETCRREEQRQLEEQQKVKDEKQ